MSNDYYPQQVGSLAPHDLWQEFKNAYDLIYQLRDKIAQMENKTATPASAPAVGGPINTMIMGLRVKPATPTDGQKLTFVAASGQIEWK